MTPSLHIVATCTDRKTVSPSVLLRDIRSGSITERFAGWRKAIRAVTPSAVVEDLYQGDHWTVVRSLPTLATSMGWRPRLWVSSAGYGVVGSQERIVSYSATFTSGHVDSVDAGAVDELAPAKWWRCATSGKKRLGRSVASIVEEDPRGTVLVLASPRYLAAMSDDLSASLEHFRGRGSLFIVSSDVPSAASDLSKCLVTSRASLQDALGGTLVSLHARAAGHLLKTVRPGSFLRENIATMSKDLDAEMGGGAPRTVGASMTDDEVTAFIRSRLKADPKLTHTRLLRELRDSKRACEQGRFRRLFRQLKPAP
jgi:hypothetical protein